VRGLNKVKTKIFFCSSCCNGGLSPFEISHSECSSPNYIVEAEVTFKDYRPRWNKFVGRFFSIDISYWLAFMGATIINVLLLPHFNLSFKESLLEAFCLGFVLIKLFKEEK
jgi:hypothetical protein